MRVEYTLSLYNQSANLAVHQRYNKESIFRIVLQQYKCILWNPGWKSKLYICYRLCATGFTRVEKYQSTTITICLKPGLTVVTRIHTTFSKVRGHRNQPCVFIKRDSMKFLQATITRIIISSSVSR